MMVSFAAKKPNNFSDLIFFISLSFIHSLSHTNTQSFVVRNSQKARYALSVRLEDKMKDDLAVKHFLIQTNQQRKINNYQHHQQ